MPRFWIAALATAAAALGLSPAAARATVTSSTISSWASSEAGTPANSSYVISLDNPPNSTTLTVAGSAPGAANTDRLDIVCYFGSGATLGDKVLVANVPVSGGAFNVTAALRPIAGHPCRLRAIPTGTEGASTDISKFDGPAVTVSEAGLPSAAIGGKPDDFYVNAMTFTANAAWNSAGSCGPAVGPLDSSFARANFAINCMGSLLGGELPLGAHRSEVQVDGQNAYDAASVQSVFAGGEDLSTFPSLTAAVNTDPSNGLLTSRSTEGWVVCPGLVAYPPRSSNCPHFGSAGVQLERDVATSDGGLVVTLTDTWSSTDQKAHSLDLLYDDYVGLKDSTAQRGYRFPGQSAFSPYGQGATLPAPTAVPGSILVRTNLAAPDGATSEAVGAITFATAPSAFTFVSNNEFEEHRVLQVPAGGSTSLTYVYSTGYTVAQVQSLALLAQDHFQPPAVAITSPGDGSTVSDPSVTLSGVATAGSGITSLVVGGQPVSVGPSGEWTATVPLTPGSNTVIAIATDGAGSGAQAQVTVIYQPPPPPPLPPAPSPTVKCMVPRTKNMKLAAAKRALRRAHCRVGRVRHLHSRKLARGRVMGTSPRAGRELPTTHKVELFVSEGP